MGTGGSITTTSNADNSTVFHLSRKKPSNIKATKTTSSNLNKSKATNILMSANTCAGPPAKPVIRGRRSIAVVDPPEPISPPMVLDPMLAAPEEDETWEEV